MSKNKFTLLILLLLVETLVLAIVLNDDNPGYGDIDLPERAVMLYIPVERNCPLDYIRIEDGRCWDAYVPTSTPWSPPPGSTPWVLPTLTPTPQPGN